MRRLEKMNVYEIDIWCQVRHNDKFSHTVTRTELIHALSEERAKKKITLKPSVTREIGTLKIEASTEFIYAIRKAGTVTKQMYYEYSDGRSSRQLSGKC